jgi:hypothetical protein
VRTAEGQQGWVAAAFLECGVSLDALEVAAVDAPTAVSHTAPSGAIATQLVFAPATQEPKPAMAAESPLKRHEAPPTGVRDQLAAFGGAAGDPCRAQANPDEPNVRVSRIPFDYSDGLSQNDTIEIGTVAKICLWGFTSGAKVTIMITRPDGASEQVSPHDDQLFLPGDPLGDYSVVASDGERQATGTFVVRPASTPRVWVLGDRPEMIWNAEKGAPATTFRIALMGLPPNQSVPLYLYGIGPNGSSSAWPWAYLAKLPAAQTNENGEALYSLSTQPDDPAGSYLVDVPPGIKANNIFKSSQFEVTAP